MASYLVAISAVVAVLSLLAVTAALPPQDEPLNQLKALLSPVVEEAVARGESSWQLGQLAGQLQRLQLRLDAVVRDVSALQLESRAGGAGGGVCHQEPAPTEEPETESGTQPPPETDVAVCEDSPAALPLAAAVYQDPAVRACAGSCLQLRDQHASPANDSYPEDGVYWFAGMSVPVLCDFSHDGGGWTLLLTAVSHPGWDPLSALGRSERSPSLTDNYSILRHADAIRDLGKGSRFAYRIEAQAEQGRQRWGGVWLAPRRYSFTDETGSQTEVSRVRWFNKWNYRKHGVQKRMPWINTGRHGTSPVLTTLTPGGDNWWGTMVSHEQETSYHHSPWIHPEADASGTVLYWMREEAV